MQIQPITFYSTNRNQTSGLRLKSAQSQPNFKGIKGILTGGAVGAGATAVGVALTAGLAAIPLFIGYVAVNGVVSAAAGHLIQNNIEERND